MQVWRSVRRRLRSQDWLIKAIIVMSILAFSLTVSLFTISGWKSWNNENTIRGIIAGIRFESADASYAIVSNVFERGTGIYNEYYATAWGLLFAIRNDGPTPLLPPTTEEYKKLRNAETDIVTKLLKSSDHFTGSLGAVELWIFTILSITQILNTIFAVLLMFSDKKDMSKIKRGLTKLGKEVAYTSKKIHD